MATGTAARRGAVERRETRERPRGATAPAEISVRDALESLEAAWAPAGARTIPQPAPHPSSGLLPAVVGGWALLILIAVAGVIAAAGASSGSCTPITYAFEGSPPPEAVAQFGVATHEINRRTGLVFEPAEPGRSKMVVAWSDPGAGGASSSILRQGTSGNLGHGTGRWRDVHGDRELVDALIAVDSTASWRLGIDRGDGLATVFVHELAHVVGLDHSSDPTSFMYHRASPRQPHWTAGDLHQLAEAGRRSGCSPR